jgi:glycosyltransferase involved in cell wall biosynthesis
MTVYVNVSSTANTRAKTGIQRVVRQITAGLYSTDEIIPIAWQGAGFCVFSSNEFQQFLAAEQLTLEQKIDIGALCKGDMFVDIDASWSDPYDVLQLYQKLKAAGVTIIKMHYDAVPILYPQFSHVNTVFAYTENFTAALQYADYWICISQTVYKDLQKISSAIGIGRPNKAILPLGADFSSYETKAGPGLDAEGLGQYILCVGTLEPRKNYNLVLDVFEALQREGRDIHLVIAGKQGWDTDDLARRIEKHEYYNRSIFWYKSATDSEIDSLYKNAYLTLCPSFYEGYGLPVVESLGRGCVTVCTAGGALEEVAAGAAYCVDLSVEAVTSAVQQLLSAELWEQYRAKASSFEIPLWSDSVSSVRSFLRNIQHVEDIGFSPRQAVYISIRPDNVFRSLTSVVRHMHFIDSAVILTSDECYDRLVISTADLPINVSVLRESELGVSELPDDHLTRNTYLRRKLYSHESIDSNFIAFDDDSFALKDIGVEDFLSNGRHKAHYFYGKGEDWLGAYPAGTSFDRGIWRTTRYLRSCGYDTRLYNSHMPQIINKGIAVMILEKTADLGFDEWTIYFNMAKHLYPAHFEDCVYRAIGWPQTDAPWVPVAVPENPIFMNFYERDLSKLPGESSNATDIVRAWTESVVYKKMLQDSIEPSQAELTLSPRGVSFSGRVIKCRRNADIYVKLLADKGSFTVTIWYGLHKRQFSEKTLPRFLDLPASLFLDKPSDVIRIELESLEIEGKFQLSIPVNIE